MSSKFLIILAFAYFLCLKDSIHGYNITTGWQCYDYNGCTPFKCVKAFCGVFNLNYNRTDAQSKCDAEIPGSSLLEIYSADDLQIAIDAINIVDICGNIDGNPYWIAAVGANVSNYVYPKTGCTIYQTYAWSQRNSSSNGDNQCSVLFYIRNQITADWFSADCNDAMFNVLCQILYAPNERCPDSNSNCNPTPSSTPKKCRKYRNY